MPFKPVDTALKVIVGPAIDDSDFKTREEGLTFDQAGMEVDVILEKHDGTIVTTAVTPTAAGDYDWAHTDQGYYSLELPAAAGASFNNTEEGIITVAVFCTGVLPFRSVSYDVVPALVYDSIVKGTDALQVDAIQISGDATAANNAELAFDGTGFGFTNCTMPTVTALTGHTAQTGDSFARIGATGSSLTSLAQAAVCTEARLAELTAANMPADLDTLLTRVTAAVALASICTDARLGELDGANLPTDIANVKAETALIVADTNELQTDWANAGRLDTILDACALEATVAALNNISTANLATALTDIKLDHLIAVADGDDPVDNSIIAMLAASDGDWSGFAIANDSLEAIRDRGDAAWITGAGGTPPQLLQTTTINALATQVSFTLVAGSVDDNAYNGAIIVITDAVSGVQKAVGRISDYTGATKTITLLEDPGIFVMAAGDTVDIIATDKLFPICTEARLAELDAANIPSDAGNAYASALGNFTVLSSAVHGNAALKALIDGVPTTAEFNARTLLAANYFDFTVDNVILGTNNDKTGYALSNVGADQILKSSTFALAMADAIWDEILTGATHNIATSAGRRVRELGAYHITSGTAQGGAAHSITLAAADTAADHIYNRNLIVILAGTGVGQTRTIVDHDNATKIAVVDRNWWINPDATSEYTIIPDDTPLVTDHGVATAGTNNTITIRASASAISSTYSNDIILIMAGTGIGQSRLISTYNGGTNVVTVCEDWVTNPDATSVYVIIPYGHAHVCTIGAAPLADIRTQADDALAAVHLDDLIQIALTVNDAGPNTTDFITSSAVAVDNWYNENMLLFTSGALAGLARVIDDYDGATKRIYLTEAFPQAPANGNQFVIVGIAGSTTTPATVADAVWDELEAGHTIAGSFGDEVTRQGKKLDRNFIWKLIQQSK